MFRKFHNLVKSSQFSYYPMVWRFHSRNTGNRANKIHERALRLVYDDSPYLSFDELLIKDKSVSIHQRNLFFYGTEKLSSLAPRIWELIPQSLKDKTELTQFKTKIKTWITSQYSRRLCEKYIGHIDFI